MPEYRELSHAYQCFALIWLYNGLRVEVIHLAFRFEELLPDGHPVHTHLALGFDRGIDAIEEGVQDEGYLFVRSMMPWDPVGHWNPRC